VDGLVADPRRQQARGGEQVLGHPVDLGRELGDLAADRVRVPSGAPGVGDRQPVRRQRRDETAPHHDHRMPLPAVGGQQDRPEDLHRLDPLLAESRRVEHRGALCERRVRQEGLHRSRR
jgi:hypothetical protein